MRRPFQTPLTVFIIVACVFVFAQNHSSAEEEQKTVASEPASQAAKNVTAIEVQGNKSISTNVIVSKMKTRIGSPYQENIISEDLKRLYLLGFFEDIKIDTQDYKDGLKVIVRVEERPIIEKVSFSGITLVTMKEEKIKQQLKSKQGQYLDYPSLTEDTDTLKAMYEKAGYGQAEIEYSVEPVAESNKVNIAFTVKEGKKVRVKNIIVEGNSSFKDSRILRLIKTKRAWLFNAGVLKDEVLKEDMERIKSFYQREGFTDIAVDYEIKQDNLKPHLLHITIKVSEGKKYLVGSVVVKGNKDIPEKEIISKISEAVPGRVFSSEAMRRDIASIQGTYFDRGYIAAVVQESEIVNAESGRVDITYTINENQIVYVDKIKIRGNVKTKDLVIRREMRIRPGERFDGDKLRRSKERLQNLGFFDEISYDTEDTQAENKKNLLVDVKETKTGSFSFGGGYSTVDQFIGFVEVEQKNFDWKNWPYFTGAGQNLKMRASVGNLSNGFELSFTEPWLFDYPVSFGFDIYRRTHERDTDVGYGYDESVTGGDLRLGKELTEYLRADLTYRLDEIKISNPSSDATNDLLNEVGKNVISVISPAVTFDSRDNVFDPRKGNLLSAAFDFAGGPLAGDKDFWKLFARASHYFPMPKGAVLEVRGRIGLADPYGDSSRVPIYERFFAGGAYTVRGYEERKVGPIDPVSKDPLGGESLAVANIEYSYPLFSFLKVAAFYDVGNVWEKMGDIFSSKDANGVANSGGFKSSFGLGLRIKTPIGPIMLDYGIPLDKEPGESDKSSGRFHFSASHGF